MLHVDEVRERLRNRLVRDSSTWVAFPGNFTSITIALRPPTERDALADQNAAIAWVKAWRTIDARIDWASRKWSRLGTQQVPTHIRLLSPDEVADFVGGATANRYRRLAQRAARIHSEWGDSEAIAYTIRKEGQSILKLTDNDFETVLQVTAWLRDHPVGRLRPRQLPVRGVDSKWFESHRTLVTALLSAAGHPTAVEVLDAPPRLRIRLLDPTLFPYQTLSDITAPVLQLAKLDLSPRAVLVCENLESILALPEIPDLVAIHGGGYAVDLVAQLPWVAHTRVLYWGDLDSHGLSILSRFRSHVPHAESILMDSQTLLDHADLWVSEPKPQTGVTKHLNDAESAALALIRAKGNVRLEQERIPWDTVLAALRLALA